MGRDATPQDEVMVCRCYLGPARYTIHSKLFGLIIEEMGVCINSRETGLMKSAAICVQTHGYS